MAAPDCPDTLYFRHALLPDGWASDVRLRIAGGVITEVRAGVPGAARGGIALPGMANLHSHTFQRAMAGRAEYRDAAGDDFWSWRTEMYRFALTMSPEDVEAVAALAFCEMVEAGFTSVAEFHYLHHAPDGGHYADIAELAARVAAGAARAGIFLVLLPVFYAHGNFGGAAPEAGQRRFINRLDDYARLLERCRALAPCGVAPHSLRAVAPEELRDVVEMAAGGPVHLHIAEQVREVADCVAWSGARSVAWLLENAPVDRRWCLVHATHTTPAELAGIAARGAVVGLCPITEANLGDGIFDAAGYAGGFGIGTDSNVLIDVAQELRQLEYGQRLVLRARNVLAVGRAETGTAVYQRAVAGGAQALGLAQAGLAVGAAADIVALPTADAPAVALNQAIFAARRPVVESVWVGGRRMVESGRHVAGEAIRRDYETAMRRMLE